MHNRLSLLLSTTYGTYRTLCPIDEKNKTSPVHKSIAEGASYRTPLQISKNLIEFPTFAGWIVAHPCGGPDSSSGPFFQERPPNNFRNSIRSFSQMSRNKIRLLASQLFTLREQAEVVNANINRVWLFSKGIDDSLSAEQVAILEAHVRRKVDHLNSVASAPNATCAAA
jgi:hypothetical protein